MGQVCVDMGPPILNAPDVPTKLKAEGEVVKAPLEVDGKTWSVTCVSMGNPHCVTFGEQGGEVKSHLLLFCENMCAERILVHFQVPRGLLFSVLEIEQF